MATYPNPTNVDGFAAMHQERIDCERYPCTICGKRGHEYRGCPTYLARKLDGLNLEELAAFRDKHRPEHVMYRAAERAMLWIERSGADTVERGEREIRRCLIGWHKPGYVVMHRTARFHGACDDDVNHHPTIEDARAAIAYVEA